MRLPGFTAESSVYAGCIHYSRLGIATRELPVQVMPAANCRTFWKVIVHGDPGATGFYKCTICEGETMARCYKSWPPPGVHPTPF